MSSLRADEQRSRALRASHRAFERLVGRTLDAAVVRVAVRGSSCYMAQHDSPANAASRMEHTNDTAVALHHVVGAAQLLVDSERAVLATSAAQDDESAIKMYAACRDAALAAVRDDVSNRLRELGMTSLSVWGMEGMAVAVVSQQRGTPSRR